MFSFFSSSSSSSSFPAPDEKFNADIVQLVKSKAEEREKLRAPVIQALQTRFEKIERGQRVWVLDWDMREGMFTAKLGKVHDRVTEGLPDNLTALYIDKKAHKLHSLTSNWTASGYLASSVMKLVLPHIQEHDHDVIRALVSPYIVLFRD